VGPFDEKNKKEERRMFFSRLIEKIRDVFSSEDVLAARVVIAWQLAEFDFGTACLREEVKRFMRL
jgi:hypothetical protein